MDRLDCDRMFVAVVETHSFTQAARQIGVSPGQASKLVARLEADLGVQLLRRSTRAVSPSDAGREYYARVRRLLADFEALDASVRHGSEAPAGRVRLTAPETFGVIQLTPVLLDFAALYPGIRLDVSLSDRRVSLVDEGVDLAVRVGNPGDSSLMARRLCDARIVTVASAAYLARCGTPLTPLDLADHDCIIDTNFSEPLLWAFADGGVPSTVSVEGRLSFSNAQACLAAAQADQGVTRVPSFVAGPALRDGRLRPVLEAFEAAPWGVHALYPSSRDLPRKVRVLIDHLASAFAGGPAWDQGWPEVDKPGRAR